MTDWRGDNDTLVVTCNSRSRMPKRLMKFLPKQWRSRRVPGKHDKRSGLGRLAAGCKNDHHKIILQGMVNPIFKRVSILAPPPPKRHD
jgi:hypothetical protein